MNTHVGSEIPNIDLIRMGENGPEMVSAQSITKDKKVVIFAVPGAYTATCTKTHLPGFVNNAQAFRDKGVDHIYCVTVNDIFVADSWGKLIGADNAGVEILADGASEFTEALNMTFSAPAVGLINRSKRYAMIVDHGKITAFEAEENPGVCELSSAEHILSLL